jgi:hypothetical protein
LADKPAAGDLEPFTDTALYALGAYFADHHPELMDDVVAQAQRIEEAGAARYAHKEGVSGERPADAHHGPRRSVLPGGGRVVVR